MLLCAEAVCKNIGQPAAIATLFFNLLRSLDRSLKLLFEWQVFVSRRIRLARDDVGRLHPLCKNLHLIGFRTDAIRLKRRLILHSRRLLAVSTTSLMNMLHAFWCGKFEQKILIQFINFLSRLGWSYYIISLIAFLMQRRFLPSTLRSTFVSADRHKFLFSLRFRSLVYLHYLFGRAVSLGLGQLLLLVELHVA